jgi:hypothetical protein
MKTKKREQSEKKNRKYKVIIFTVITILIGLIILIN